MAAINIDLKHTLVGVKEKHQQGAEVLWDTFKSRLQITLIHNKITTQLPMDQT